MLVGQVGFHRTVICILNKMCGISSNCPTCLCGTGDYLEWTSNFDGKLGHECRFHRHSLFSSSPIYEEQCLTPPGEVIRTNSSYFRR